MFKAARLAALLLTTSTLTGCVVAIGNDGFDDDEQWEQSQKRNERYIDSIKLGARIGAMVKPQETKRRPSCLLTAS